jgi:hypothetical protein
MGSAFIDAATNPHRHHIIILKLARQVSQYSKESRRELAKASGVEFLELLSRPRRDGSPSLRRWEPLFLRACRLRSGHRRSVPCDGVMPCRVDA